MKATEMEYLLMRGLRKKPLQITSAMHNPKDEYFVLVKAIEDQMFGKP
jgi:hypothetical protein